MEEEERKRLENECYDYFVEHIDEIEERHGLEEYVVIGVNDSKPKEIDSGDNVESLIDKYSERPVFILNVSDCRGIIDIVKSNLK